jgi:K+-sensing histidine kinase KdpD
MRGKDRLPIKPSARVENALATVTGALFAAGAAILASWVFANSASSAFVPPGFVVVLLAVAFRYGGGAGIFGALLSALIFAYFLFSPFGSVKVELDTTRQSLGWMLMIGIPGCYFMDHARNTGR